MDIKKWHRWAGLFAAFWLAVLGVTGFLINHKDDWDWLYQCGISKKVLPPGIIKSAEGSLVRFYQINPVDPSTQIAAGMRGAWYSADKAATWSKSDFGKTPAPLVLGLLPDADWKKIWYATSDGIWVSDNQGKTLKSFALSGQRISSIAFGSQPSELVGIVDRSRGFRLRLDNTPAEPQWLDFHSPVGQTKIPAVDLSRLLTDVHYGKGLIGTPWDRWIIDIVGLGLFFMCLSGVWMWFVARQVRHKKMKPRSVYTWMRLHGYWVGVAIFVFLFLQFVTGMYIGHFSDLSKQFKQIRVAQVLHTPALRLYSWNDQIESVIGYPAKPDMLSVGTKFGLFTSEDNGQHWSLESGIQGGAYRIRRLGNDVFIPGTMSSTTQLYTQGKWHKTEGSKHMEMVSEVSPGEKGQLVWKHGSMLHISDLEGKELKAVDFKGPKDNAVPLITVFVQIHNGAIFFKGWKWVNDIFALAGCFLVVTGFMRFLKRMRWIS